MLEINTSDVPTDDGRCYRYLRSDNTVQATGILPPYPTGSALRPRCCQYLSLTDTACLLACRNPIRLYVAHPHKRTARSHRLFCQEIRKPV
ncbi:hypothetical protein GGR53DRAFT_510257 [Hypoxylon sp. FL1150]|nr:hypothetical protein GGR53DRAFT_510257 [Hypoxylon sp. FL1150]